MVSWRHANMASIGFNHGSITVNASSTPVVLELSSSKHPHMTMQPKELRGHMLNPKPM